MHSITLSEAAMNTDAESLAEGILLTADVSYLKAVMEVRGEIVAAGYTPSAEVPTAHDLDLAGGALGSQFAATGASDQKHALSTGPRPACLYSNLV